MPVQFHLQIVQSQPKAICIKVAMPLEVLERRFILSLALTRFPGAPPAIAGPASQVPALAIPRRALSALHQKGEPRTCEVPQQFQIYRGSEVIRVGDKQVFLASRQQLIKQSASQQRRIKIPMTGGTPFEVRLSRTGNRTSNGVPPVMGILSGAVG